MKGIILAGGSGTRLYPLTKVISKQLLPVYDKPMIYYPLSVLMLAGIKDILIIATPEDCPNYEALLGNGNQFGITLTYKIQTEPRGLAEAFLIGEDFIGEDRIAMILGDNIYFGTYFTGILQEAAKRKNGATIFGYKVNDPKRFGVVEIDDKSNAISIEEKPRKPRSRYAVTGLYFYDNDVIQIAKKIKPSSRGELEITDINKEYLKTKNLNVQILGRGFAWFDAGTHQSLQAASSFIEMIENRQGFKVACIEEIAYRMKYISKEQLIKLAEPLLQNDYGRYLMEIVEE